jgi:hypothetical protein
MPRSLFGFCHSYRLSRSFPRSTSLWFHVGCRIGVFAVPGRHQTLFQIPQPLDFTLSPFRRVNFPRPLFTVYSWPVAVLSNEISALLLSKSMSVLAGEIVSVQGLD